MILKAKINSPDNVTANADLIYKIYDDGALFFTSGSANSDNNVSIANDIVTIEFSTVEGQDYSFSVTAVDEAGNEAAASNILQSRDTVGTLIHEDMFADLSMVRPAPPNVVHTNPGGNLRVASTGAGTIPIVFQIFNSQFSITDGSFLANHTYAFELDVAAIGGQVGNANYFRNVFTLDDGQQVWQPTVVGKTLRWQRTGQSNGSITFAFAGDQATGPNPSTPWTAGDSIDLSAVRIYDLGANP